MAQKSISSLMTKHGFFLEEATVEDMLVLLESLVTNIVSRNDAQIIKSRKIILTPFNSKTIPEISIGKYLRRLALGVDVGVDVLINVIAYFIRLKVSTLSIEANSHIDNFCTVDYPNGIDYTSQIYNCSSTYTEFHSVLSSRNPLYHGLFLNSYNIHRILLTAMTAAQKLSSDFFYKNSSYAKIGGISTEELNFLEMELLFLLQFNLFVGQEEQQRIGEEILRQYIVCQLEKPAKIPKLLQVDFSQSKNTRKTEISTF
ncbi:hypothetical protein BB561_003981 [Smittium simulii]|uniref:Cyclin n=1 Tax=Smittium simulii TaxID=133385 RepID=A0A2T9YIL0_9FUNG|nr:hypothetical protein BB561_003981 [Smittium simulii]